MARPRSEDKRNAILAVAIEVFAEQGVSAPTAKIAKLAGVAEGTLFTYFSTKDELLNALYLELKTEVREAVIASSLKGKTPRHILAHTWQSYVNWGVGNPKKRKVVAQLGVSGRITEANKVKALEGFYEVSDLVTASTTNASLREFTSGFGLGIMGSLAETTMDFMAQFPEDAQRYVDAGFEAFWNVITG